MIRKLLVLLPMAISTVAFAAESNVGSEYMHQAAGGKIEVTPEVEYHSWTLKDSSSNKTTVSGLNYGVKGEYGINDMFSAGIAISANSDTAKPDGGTNQTRSGMNNIDVYGLGKSDIGAGLLRYGLDFAISTAKVKDNNVDTGATWLTPFIGWEMGMGPGIFGLKFSYSFMLTNRQFDTTDDEKGVSAESLSAFYEWQMNNWSLGLSLAWNGVNGGKVDGTKQDDGHAGLFVQVYAPIVLADNITLIPHVGWGDNGSLMSMGTEVNTWMGWDIGAAARFAF